MPQTTATNPTSTKAQRTRTRATAKRSRAPQSPPETLEAKPVEGTAAGYPPRRPKAAGPWQDAATAAQSSEGAPLTPTPEAEALPEPQPSALALLEELRQHAALAWLAWYDARHKDASDSIVDLGEQVVTICDELADGLTPAQLHALLAIPEVWAQRADEGLDEDHSWAEAIRTAVANAVSDPLHALTEDATPAALLFARLKVQTLQRFQAWAEEQPHDAIDMHRGDLPDAPHAAWEVIRGDLLHALSPEQIRQLASLDEVWAYRSEHGAQGETLEHAVRHLVDEQLMYRALDWLEGYTAPASVSA